MFYYNGKIIHVLGQAVYVCLYLSARRVHLMTTHVLSRDICAPARAKGSHHVVNPCTRLCWGRVVFRSSLSVPYLAALLSFLLARERQAAISQHTTWYHVTHHLVSDWWKAKRMIYLVRAHWTIYESTWAFLPCWLNSRNYHSK